MTDRRRRRCIPSETPTRQRHVEAFEDACEDYLVVGVTLGVNRSTSRSIIATFLKDCRMEERPRGGSNNVKVDEEMRQCLNEIIDENFLLTLAQTN